MSVDSLIFWLFVAAWVLLLVMLVVGPLAKIVTEVKQIVAHLVGLVNGSDLPLQIAKAEADLARCEAALAQVPALQLRAESALVVLRTTPLIPPAIAALIERIRVEILAFRRAVG